MADNTRLPEHHTLVVLGAVALLPLACLLVDSCNFFFLSPPPSLLPCDLGSYPPMSQGTLELLFWELELGSDGRGKTVRESGL